MHIATEPTISNSPSSGGAACKLDTPHSRHFQHAPIVRFRVSIAQPCRPAGAWGAPMKIVPITCRAAGAWGGQSNGRSGLV